MENIPPEVSQAAEKLQTATQTLAGLEDKKRGNIARQHAIATERKATAYTGFTVGGRAETRLKELSREATELTIEVENLDIAISYAKRNVVAASRLVDSAKQRHRASEILVLAEEYARLGEEAHVALDAGHRKLAEAEAILSQIELLGGRVPDYEVRAGAIDTALVSYQFLFRRPQAIKGLPPPGMRRGINAVFGHIAASIAYRSKIILGGGTPPPDRSDDEGDAA